MSDPTEDMRREALVPGYRLRIKAKDMGRAALIAGVTGWLMLVLVCVSWCGWQIPTAATGIFLVCRAYWAAAQAMEWQRQADEEATDGQ